MKAAALKCHERLRCSLKCNDIHSGHHFAQVCFLGAPFDSHDLPAGQLGQAGDAAVASHHDLLAGNKSRQRETDDAFPLPRVGESSGQQIYVPLLQLRDSRAHRNLLDHGGHADLARNRAAKIDFISDDRPCLRIHKAHGLVRGQHSTGKLTLVTNVRKLIGTRRPGCRDPQGKARYRSQPHEFLFRSRSRSNERNITLAFLLKLPASNIPVPIN
jgi:hypothetical protein